MDKISSISTNVAIENIVLQASNSFCKRLFNTVVESIVNQPEQLPYPSPFTKSDTVTHNWISSAAPCFPVNFKNITILTEPQQFYNAILGGCKAAKDRITLVSLYLGNGNLEEKLVDNILKNENFTNGTLKVNVLLDFTRGSRFKHNSRKLLKPLLEKNEDTCEVSLYHTPALRGMAKKLVPDRWNELFGLQHMKLYIFDDTLVISGANLSNDYFTNRQDRYYVIKDKNLTDFYCGLVKRVQSFSFKMDKYDNVSLREGWMHSPYEGKKQHFVDSAGDLIKNYILDAKDEHNIYKREGYDTWVFPLMQMGQLGVYHDSIVTDRLLADSPKDSQLCIATGYFNLTYKYMHTILYKCEAKCRLLMAHPDANGFKNAKGAAGGIPAAYCYIADSFRKKIEKLGQQNRIIVQEYLRPGWTYHAKGLWYYPPGSEFPSLTLVGSPNFGERSVKRDLETQLAIVTENEELRKQMHEECSGLYKLALPIEKERHVPAWVQAMVLLFRGYF